MRLRSWIRLIYRLAGLCLFVATPALADAPPRVLVSVKPLHSLVAGLMAGVAEPELIIPDDNPARFQPTPDQQASLEGADLVIWLGPEFEPALAGPLQQPGMTDRSLELLSMEALKVLPAREGGGDRDPYIWLDTRNMLILLDEISALLAARDPVRAHRYESNRLKVLAALSQLDRELEYGYKHVSSVPVFTYHDSHQYFEQAYAMKVAAIATSQNRAPAAETLLRMRSLLDQAASPCVLTEAALPEPHLDLLLAGTDARIVEIDSFGSRLKPGPDLYLQMMRDQFRAIRDCAGKNDAMAPAESAAAAGSKPGVELYPHRIQSKYLLMNHYGETVSNLDFAGSYQLIYFGYTFCPDICPTSLAIMTQALKMLGPGGDRIQPLFISVDPDRDTIEALRTYTAYFHPRLIGLTGPADMIARTAEQFHVRYEKVLLEGRDPEKYAVDHTSALFLLGPNGEFVAKFAHGLPAPDLAARLEELITE